MSLSRLVLSPLRRLSALGALLALSACVGLEPGALSGTGQSVATTPMSREVITTSGKPFTGSPEFTAVLRRVEPVAENLCLQMVRGRSCAFTIAVEDDPSQPANAFQTLDGQGRPIVVFTIALLKAVQNADELAFVLGHEAAHHIAGHIPRRQDQAMTGAMLAGVLAGITGASAEEIKAAQNFGADMASRQYSKDFELEADALGAEIAWNAGYDPVRGAAFFARLPDPGDRFLGSHPPNAQRQQVVAQTVARLRGTR